jgi:hypothetical protein
MVDPNALYVVAKAHALCAAVAQLPSTPPASHPRVVALGITREARDRLAPEVRDAARAELGRLHPCPSLLKCPWGRNGVPVLPPTGATP